MESSPKNEPQLNYEQLGEEAAKLDFDELDRAAAAVSSSSSGGGAAAAPANVVSTIWNLNDEYGLSTALHEIGHTLGLPHEHMSPFAGIEWDRNAVYSQFSQPPNNWSREMIEHNILKQLDKRQVKGSQWGPDFIMEYDFESGLIKAPTNPINYW